MKARVILVYIGRYIILNLKKLIIIIIIIITLIIIIIITFIFKYVQYVNLKKQNYSHLHYLEVDRHF